MRRRGGVLAIGVLTIGFCVAASPASAATWVEVMHPHVGGKDELLYDVTAVADDDVWAVGYNQGPVGGSYEFRTHVLHWDGATWTRSSSRDVEGAPATNLLYGVGASGPDDVWTVGWHREPRSIAMTLIERWNGESWNIVASPNPSTYGNYLRAVAAATTTSAWAVGTQYIPALGAEGPMAMRWGGAQWTASTLPRVKGCSGAGALTDVVALGANDAVATGWCRRTDGGRDMAYVLRWKGAWTVMWRANGETPSTRLTTVAATGAGDVWVMGQKRLESSTVPYFFHYDGVGWTRVQAPQAGAGPDVLGSAVHPSAGAWAVGTTSEPGNPWALRMSLVYDGTRWRIAPTPGYSRVTGVTFTPSGTVWAVGFDIDESLIMTR